MKILQFNQLTLIRHFHKREFKSSLSSFTNGLLKQVLWQQWSSAWVSHKILIFFSSTWALCISLFLCEVVRKFQWNLKDVLLTYIFIICNFFWPILVFSIFTTVFYKDSFHILLVIISWFLLLFWQLSVKNKLLN